MHMMQQAHDPASRELIQADVDGELEMLLDAQELRSYHEHLAACPRCRELREALRGMRSALAAVASTEPLRAGFEADLLDKLGAHEAAAPVPLPRGAWLAGVMHGLAGVALGAAAMALVVAMRPEQEHVPAQLLAAQHSAELAGRPLDVVAAQPAEAARWLDRRLPFRVPQANLETTGFRLAGARLEAINHRPVAILVYRSQSGADDDVSLAVWEEPNSQDSTPTSLQRGQDHFVYWRHGRLEFWAWSRLPPDTLGAFARAWKSASI